MEQLLDELKEINQKLDNISSESHKIENVMMNVEETAEFLKISDSKVYELMKQNQIPFVKAGRRKLVPKNKLLKWIDNSIETGIEKQRDKIYQFK